MCESNGDLNKVIISLDIFGCALALRGWWLTDPTVSQSLTAARGKLVSSFGYDEL